MKYMKLNEPIALYEEFLGPINEQMPLIIDNGRVPMNIKDIAERRLEVLNSSFKIVRSSWLFQNFDTGDAIFYHPHSRKFKIDLDSKIMRKINSKTELNEDGLLILPEDIYYELDGKEFTHEEVNTVKKLTKKKILENPVYRLLFREDKVLLGDYIDFVFGEIGSDPYYKEEDIFSLCLDYAFLPFIEEEKNKAYGSLLRLYALFNRSDIVSVGELTKGYHFMVGVYSDYFRYGIGDPTKEEKKLKTKLEDKWREYFGLW